MKTISSLLLLLGAVVTAVPQSSFRAVLTPIVPTPQNEWITGAAAFELNGNAVQFTISLGFEDVVPSVARLAGSQSAFTFDLGTPFITIHSPGPWPNGYDGSTAFFGSFSIPANLREEFVAGQTTLLLLGSWVGDFHGPVLPATAPQIGNLSRQGSGIQIQFMARSPYQYTVEYSDSLSWANTVGFTNVSALSQSLPVVVTDPVSSAGARFYRIRRELCCQ